MPLNENSGKGAAGPPALKPKRTGKSSKPGSRGVTKPSLTCPLPCPFRASVGKQNHRKLPAPSLGRRVAAEGLGAFFLFACVIGSGIMAERLSGGNDAVALLGNTLATGAMLFVLIAMLGPISGAHMNPAVSLVAAARGELSLGDAAAYIAAQLAFG